jgi:O-antigen ligase
MLFLLNIIFVATGRTALIVVAVLLVLFAIRHFGWKGALATLLAGCALAAVLWASSPYLRERVSATLDEVERYRTEREETSAGFRLEFWKKSVEIIARAPLIGHGTGSITEQFRRLAVGQTGMAAVVTPNPHNQTLTVGIQLGFLGIALLYAMWIAHLALFRGGGTIAWIGLVIVVQNIIGSMFNTHLFDFTEGWIYVFLVGVAGGLARREDGQTLLMPIRSASALRS